MTTPTALTVPTAVTPSADSDGPQGPIPDTLPLTSLDAALVMTARAQRGMLTTAQATAAGLSAPVLVKLVKAGVLRHPGRGLYAVEALCESDPEAWHRQLCAGAFLLYPDAVLAGTSALFAHGIPIWGAPLAAPTILRPVKRAGGMICVLGPPRQRRVAIDRLGSGIPAGVGSGPARGRPRDRARRGECGCRPA